MKATVFSNKSVLGILAGFRPLFVCTVTVALFCVISSSTNPENECVYKLSGEINDITCKDCRAEQIDIFNTEKVQPLLSKLLERDYFRFYKDQIPAALKNNESCNMKKVHENEPPETPEYSETENDNNELGLLDVTISDENKEAFQVWNKHDEEQKNFCEIDDIESSEVTTVYDLVRNPERFTGYSGPSAVNVWKLIYDQNCFKPDHPTYAHYLPLDTVLCLEKRTFFQLISGFHTSINVDVAANWLIPAKTVFDQPSWGPNVEEFVKRFHPKYTYGDGPNRLRNLYFAYLVEMRALIKVAPYLQKKVLYTGNNQDDDEVKQMVNEFLEILKSYPSQFDENKLFQGDGQKLMKDFKVQFRNISRVMDCVGCDKCRLWGKVQITGMGTALKILFSQDSMPPTSPEISEHPTDSFPFQLLRGEIVALFNAFGRLSKSIHELEMFRKLLC